MDTPWAPSTHSRAAVAQPLELLVVGVVAIAEEDDVRAPGFLLRQQATDVGDDLADSLPYLEGIALLAEAPQHIHHQHHVGHRPKFLQDKGAATQLRPLARYPSQGQSSPYRRRVVLLRSNVS